MLKFEAQIYQTTNQTSFEALSVNVLFALGAEVIMGGGHVTVCGDGEMKVLV